AIGEEINAYSLLTEQDAAFIIVGNLTLPAVLRNFDIAHELGQLLLHYKIEFTHLTRKEHKAIENEANRFAGAFLLPEEAFLEDMNSIASRTNPDAYIDLKEKWNTSLQVLGYRAMHLGLLDAKKHSNFYAKLNRKSYSKREQLDETLAVQKPQKVKTIIDFISKQNIINMHNMLEKDWKVEVEFLHLLTRIDTNFFKQYIVQEEDFELIQVNDFMPKT